MPTDLELGTSTLLSKRGMQGAMRPSVLSLAAVTFVLILGGVGTVALQGGQDDGGYQLTMREEVAPTAAAVGASPAADPNLVYFGNGCFWERQWAYYNVETDKAGPFARAAADFTAYVGYAGGQNPPNGGSAVCYHTGDERDYAHLGVSATWAACNLPASPLSIRDLEESDRRATHLATLPLRPPRQCRSPSTPASGASSWRPSRATSSPPSPERAARVRARTRWCASRRPTSDPALQRACDLPCRHD